MRACVRLGHQTGRAAPYGPVRARARPPDMRRRGAATAEAPPQTEEKASPTIWGNACTNPLLESGRAGSPLPTNGRAIRGRPSWPPPLSEPLALCRPVNPRSPPTLESSAVGCRTNIVARPHRASLGKGDRATSCRPSHSHRRPDNMERRRVQTMPRRPPIQCKAPKGNSRTARATLSRSSGLAHLLFLRRRALGRMRTPVSPPRSPIWAAMCARS